MAVTGNIRPLNMLKVSVRVPSGYVRASDPGGGV